LTSTESVRRMISLDYSRSSTLYENLVVPIHTPVARKLLKLARLRKGEKILDVGTGTGLFALMAADRVGKTGFVIGVDIAEGMLAIAKRKAAKLDLRSIEFRRMGARES
jgi:ubiquinone/menaquinone biosynthesis C-methylase UbiE